MKKLLFAVIFTLKITFIFSQSLKNDEITNTEKELSKAGTFFQNEHFRIGNIGEYPYNLSVQVVKYKDLNSSFQSSYVKVEYDVYTSIIDKDEIDMIIKSMTKINLEYLSTKKDIYTEYILRTRGAFLLKTENSSAENKWKSSVMIKSYNWKSNKDLKNEEFSKLLELFIEAKSKLI